jgi:hypothetical protein
MKKLLVLAVFCAFIVAGAIGCGGEPTKPAAPAAGGTPATGAKAPGK